MAKRNVLHISKLENLKKWLVQDGWNILPSSNNPYEVLRVVKDGKQTHSSFTQEKVRNTCLLQTGICQ